MNISGIYQIQSKIHPDRIYIGSAVSIQGRWSKHISHLRHNKHYSIKLQRHFIKYGEPDLQFSILCTCERNQLIQFEQYFLDFYHPYFNTCKIAGSNLGVVRSKEAREKYSRSKLGNTWNIGRKHSKYFGEAIRRRKLGTHLTEEIKQKIRVTKSIPVLQFDKQKNFIKEWFSAREVQRVLLIHEGDISLVARGHRKTAGGFIWKYKNIEL